MVTRENTNYKVKFAGATSIAFTKITRTAFLLTCVSLSTRKIYNNFKPYLALYSKVQNKWPKYRKAKIKIDAKRATESEYKRNKKYGWARKTN